MRTPIVQMCLALQIAALASPSHGSAQELEDMMLDDPEQAKQAADDDAEQDEDDDVGQAEDDEAFVDEERPPGEESGEEEAGAADENAEADAPDDAGKPFSVGALVGYGASLEKGPNLWSVGFGLQGGYDLGLLTLGLRFVYYIGGTATEQTFDNFGVVTEQEVSANLWELSVEAGVDLELSDEVLLRPGLGIGFVSVSEATDLYGVFSPGLALLYDVSDTVYLGLDGRFQVVASDPEAATAIVMLATVGMRL